MTTDMVPSEWMPQRELALSRLVRGDFCDG